MKPGSKQPGFFYIFDYCIIKNLALKKFILCLLLLISFLGSEYAFSQNRIQTDSQLAFGYFRDKEYQPAASLFFNLHKATRSKTYFNYYIDCLIQLEDFQEAEKAIKKEIKKNPDDRSFLIALGFLYKKAGENEKHLNQYNKVLDKLIPVKSQITSIANSFLGKREFDYAIKTYIKGRELLKQDHLFHLELANIFLAQRDFEKMVSEYLLALTVDPSLNKQIQNRLQSALLQDINSSLDPILKNQLLKKIQTQSDNLSFKELLLWYFTQKKQFKAAFTQARSLDLLNNEDGTRLISLANASKTNHDYATALKCFQLVIDKGEAFPKFLTAQMGDLETRYENLQIQNSYSLDDWSKLADRYQKLFETETNYLKAISSVIQYAHIKAFYLRNPNKSIELLESTLAKKGINSLNKSRLKIELADIKLFTDDKWDAILLYSQIEKSNKNNELGYDAKFKKAKVSYYMGEVIWAKAQLDALKGSTSKLIANDAIALSQMISDNTTLDTSYTAIKLFADADFSVYQRKDSLAILKLDKLLKNHPGHTLSDEAYFMQYEIFYKANKMNQANEALSRIINEHPYESLAAKALLTQAELYEKLQKPEKAKENYKTIVTEYPDSIFSIDARNKLEQLRK